ncbi:hypothetical protein LTR40_001604 [Exophiala xenobiotica]|nr:hypothetical protein LTR40_001604 [Exophiala xenobiotica]
MAYNRLVRIERGLIPHQRTLITIPDRLLLADPYNPTHILTNPSRGSNLFICRCLQLLMTASQCSRPIR